MAGSLRQPGVTRCTIPLGTQPHRWVVGYRLRLARGSSAGASLNRLTFDCVLLECGPAQRA